MDYFEQSHMAYYSHVFKVMNIVIAIIQLMMALMAQFFFLLTGFHGLHVIIGSIFLIVCFWRHVEYHFSDQHHLGMELAILY
jgi:heme/copper-type cytochrome/quinol oxidase subunit 3